MKILFNLLSVCCAVFALCMLAWCLITGASFANTAYGFVLPLMMAGVLASDT